MTALRDLMTRAARPDNVALELAVVLIATGLVGILLAWGGVSLLLLVPLQLPYVVSGGLGGLALVGMGLALLDVQSARRAHARERDEIDFLTVKAAEWLDRERTAE